MTTYSAPTQDSRFVLNQVLRIQDYAGLDGFAELTADTVGDVLGQVGSFCAEVLHPLNRVSDEHGCTYHPDGAVSTPPGFPEAYRAYADGGWTAAGGPPEYGGHGLPSVLTFAYQEYVWAANPSFAMQASHLGHAELIRAHGTDRQREQYVEPLVTGRWAGAMALTEPQAGSDLGLIRTSAAPSTAGGYRLTGTKVFTTGGEHDLTENIIHLVLARIEGAPPGTRGISLFLVPKLLFDENGAPAGRNRLSCGGVERKMGLHGSPTCVMNYDGATGYLLGEPNRGLAGMFLLMNHMRLVTAALGLGVSEIAYQNAAQYAKQRRQGRAPGGPRDPEQPADLLVALPDVRRILLEIRSFNESARALVLWVALQTDLARLAPESARRERAGEYAALLGPVVKGLVTEWAFDNAVGAQQLFGGYGYVAETGVEQFVRDVRMATVGEGVTAVQAADLVRRKMHLRRGAVLEEFLAEMEAALHAPGEAVARCADPLRRALGDLRAATRWIRERGAEDANAPAAVGAHYLRLFGRVALGWMWVRIVAAVSATGDGDLPGETRAAAKLALAEFYLQRLPAETGARLAHIRAGHDALMRIPDEQL